MGVFARSIFASGELIAVWGGVIYSADELSHWAQSFPAMASHPVSVARGFYLGPVSPTDEIDDAERFNHSCAPNAGVKGQIVLLARRLIQPGEEVCFDYDTTELDGSGQSFRCRCESDQCRGTISGTAWKDRQWVERNNSWLAWHVHEAASRSLNHTE